MQALGASTRARSEPGPAAQAPPFTLRAVGTTKAISVVIGGLPRRIVRTSASTRVSSSRASSLVERIRGSFLLVSIGRLLIPEATPLLPASPCPPIRFVVWPEVYEPARNCSGFSGLALEPAAEYLSGNLRSPKLPRLGAQEKTRGGPGLAVTCGRGSAEAPLRYIFQSIF